MSIPKEQESQKVSPITYEMMENTELASGRVAQFVKENYQEWQKMTPEEQDKIIDEIYRKTASEESLD